MNKKTIGLAFVLSSALIAGGAVVEGGKHPEPKEPRDTTFTIRSDTQQTENVRAYLTTVNIISALGLEFPKD